LTVDGRGIMAAVMDAVESNRVCPACDTSLPAAALFCSRCGFHLEGPKPAPAAAGSKWYYNVWFVLFMLFFVAGPFGLPLVWKNPRFSGLIKLILTLTMVLYTLLLVDMTVKAVRSVLQEVERINAAYQ